MRKYLKGLFLVSLIACVLLALSALPALADGGAITLPANLKVVETEAFMNLKAASVTLTDGETKDLEALADSLNLNVIRFWEKEMK